MLVDLGLPDIDGYEVARRVRKGPHGDRITIVALSGYGSEEHTERATAAGFDLHLVKPVEVEALTALFAQAPRAERASGA
jgi:CheY-like chemotaxis protein